MPSVKHDIVLVRTNCHLLTYLRLWSLHADHLTSHVQWNWWYHVERSTWKNKKWHCIIKWSLQNLIKLPQPRPLPSRKFSITQSLYTFTCRLSAAYRKLHRATKLHMYVCTYNLPWHIHQRLLSVGGSYEQRWSDWICSRPFPTSSPRPGRAAGPQPSPLPCPQLCSPHELLDTWTQEDAWSGRSFH